MLGDLTIDYAERHVTVAGQPVELTATEYEMLSELSVNAGTGVDPRRVAAKGMGDQRRRCTGDPHPRPARRVKLGDDARSPTYIFAERRVGYRMPKGQEPGQVPRRP